jgi:hypothetical protein
MRHFLLLLTIGCVSPEATEESVSTDITALTCSPSTAWCQETAPAAIGTTLLHGVWAVSASDVFAVGNSGTIIRRVNGTWTAMSSGGATANLRGVWAASSSDAWAVGSAGTIVRFNGTAWSLVTGTGITTDLEAVWGSSSTDVWLVGGGTVWHWNGSAFSSTAFSGPLLAVSGTSSQDVWVTGESTNLHHFNGTTWEPPVNPGLGTSSFSAIRALTTTDVWVADGVTPKATGHLTGGRWVAVDSNTGLFNSLSALGASDIWGCGGTKIGHWNGSSWTTVQQSFSGSPGLWSVTTTAGHGWVVGASALIAHRTF